jgi:hypothetical protein
MKQKSKNTITNNKPKNKTIACYLALFLGFLGIHLWYLGKNFYLAIFHIIITLSGGFAWFYFLTTQNTHINVWIWFLLSLFILNWCILWLTCIFYGLMSHDKWLAYINIENNKNNAPDDAFVFAYANTNALTLLCIIIALLIGAGSVMAFLSFAIQSYYL